MIPTTLRRLAALLLLAFVALLPRCVSNPQPDIPQDAIVTYETLRLEFPDVDPDAALSASSFGDAADKEARVLRAPLVGEPSGLRQITILNMQRTNLLVHGALATMQNLTRPEPVVAEENLFVWFQAHDSLITRLFLVPEAGRRDAESRFAYRLEVAPVGADEAALRTHLEGFFDRRDAQRAGSLRRRGEGVLVYDFDPLRAIDPRSPAGQITVGFRNRGLVRQVTALVDDLQTSPDEPAISSRHRYLQLPGGGGEFVFFTADDVVGREDGLVESVALHSVWNSRGDGRAVALVSGGSAGPDPVLIQECWDARGVVVWSDSTPDIPDFEGGSREDCDLLVRDLDLSAPVFDPIEPGEAPEVPAAHPDEQSE